MAAKEERHPLTPPKLVNWDSLTESIKKQLYEMLELNVEQLTSYLEETILENPFIEISYPLEANVSRINNKHLPHIDPHIEQESLRASQSLPMFLFEQILMYRQTPIRDMMVRLVDYIDERGYLPYDYKDLAKTFGEDPLLVLDAMTLIKQLEPAGVGAFDLQECLMLQTEQDSKAPAVAYYLLESHFEQLSKHDLAGIVEKSTLTRAEIETCLQYFHSLRPIPSELFETNQVSNAIPDVFVTFQDSQWEVAYNQLAVAHIHFSQDYFNDMRQYEDEQISQYLASNREQFIDLIETLAIREALILAVAQQIVDTQKDYLFGHTREKAPYLIKAMANQLALPESVVSLIIRNKTFEWQNKIYPFNDFINAIQGQGRGGFNAANIKHLIHTLILEEGEELTNAEIVSRLDAQKILISEQLVEDYRKSLKDSSK